MHRMIVMRGERGEAQLNKSLSCVFLSIEQNPNIRHNLQVLSTKWCNSTTRLLVQPEVN